MKKFEGMLFCTDLDGTLFTSDKKVSKENLEKIEYFKSEGGLFTFITGRDPSTAKAICDIVKPNAPYGCLNGGGIFDAQKNEYLWNMFLDDKVKELISAVDKNIPEMGILFNTKKAIYFSKNNSAMEYFRSVTGAPNIVCDYEDMSEPILKIVFADEKEENIWALIDLLNSHPNAEYFDFIRSERRLYEILPKGVSKGALLCKMAELFGIEMSKTIAVGDYNNDVSMIKTAGIGFAVSNAVDEAKAVADYITVSNNEHAIAKIIDGLDRGDFER